MFTKTRNFYGKYKERLMPVALLLGFVIDNFTLTRIDQTFDNLVLFTYLAIAGLGIILVNYLESRLIPGEEMGGFASWMPVVIQFAFGGLFSGYFVFYSRSGSLAGSWIFLLLLASLLVGNETFKKYYSKLIFQVSIFFVALLSFAIFYIPILLGSIGVWEFLLSGFISVLLIRIFMRVIARTTKYHHSGQYRMVHLSIGLIYIAVNILYFTNSIPPIPLSLKDAGVYHQVERLPSGNYRVLEEERAWYEVYKSVWKEYSLVQGSPAYFYAAVFSPTDLDTTIIHSWQSYNEVSQKWVDRYQLPYSIIGGRGNGYRAYSVKENLTEGTWRVDVMTERKQLLGRYVFDVISAEETPVLVEKVLK